MDSQVKMSFEGLKDTKEAPVAGPPPGMVWREVSGGSADDYWKPGQVGDSIVGKHTGSFDGYYGKVELLEVEGKVVGLPSNTMLQNLMLKVPLGSLCRVTFEGTKLNDKKQSYNVFRVEVASPDSFS